MLTKTSDQLAHCFCETLLDDQIDIRCDRMTCENKGGVLICVPSLHRLATSGIEAVSTTVQLGK